MTNNKKLIAVLVVYGLLSLFYNVASPIFEPPDEATHFRYVKYLVDHKKLPAVIDDGTNREDVWGLHQPPLYFIISAVLASPFKLIAPDDFLERNPHVNLGFAQRPGNKNFFVHIPAEEFPYQGFPLVIRYLRLLSTLCGAITLIIVYFIGLDLFAGNKKLALLAPILMTLHPQFVFINAAIANEPLNILLMAAGLWGCIKLILNGPSLKLALLLGLAAGLITLAKMTGLALILLIVIAMLLAAIQGYSAPKLWQFGFVVAVMMALVGSWWYIRNIFLYGDPWQQGMYLNFYHDVQRSLNFSSWLNGIKNGEVSFWATFGWFNILVPEWMYIFYKLLTRVALFGLLIGFIKLYISKQPSIIGGRRSSGCLQTQVGGHFVLILFLFTSPLISSLVLTRLIATEGGIQGRQLLPMLPALALLIVIGYYYLTPAKLRVGVAVGLGIMLLILTLFIPPFIIAPAYATPPVLAKTELPPSIIPLNRTYGDEIALLGYELPKQQAIPGQLTSLTLYWQAIKPIKKDYTVFVHALGQKLERVGVYNGYPGLGNFPTSQWLPNNIVKDRYEFFIDPTATGPTLLRLHVGLFDFDRLDLPALSVKDEVGNDVSTLITHQTILEDADLGDCIHQSVTFNDHIQLVCYRILNELFSETGDAVKLLDDLTLYWQVDAPPSTDYTVFIQFWQDGKQIIGFDGPPFEGDFPSSYWQPDYRLADVHPIDWEQVPSGTYQVLVGLYNPHTGERLPVFDETGQPLPDYAVNLGEVVRY